MSNSFKYQKHDRDAPSAQLMHYIRPQNKNKTKRKRNEKEKLRLFTIYMGKPVGSLIG